VFDFAARLQPVDEAVVDQTIEDVLHSGLGTACAASPAERS
jgi:hypothetical protein